MDKYQQAILALNVAVQEVSRLSEEIGKAIEASLVAQDPPEGVISYRHQSINWLERAYQMEYEEETPYSDGEKVYVHHDGDVDKYLAANCPHALRAHQLIQQRKAAKKNRASARRWITKLGKELAATTKESHD